MEKLVYLIRNSPGNDGKQLRDELLSFSRECSGGATRFTVNVTDDAVAEGKGVTIGKLDPPISAMLSFWMENSDDRAPIENALTEKVSAIAGYLVVESVPTVNQRHAVAAGERTPGVNMVTCITQLPALSREEFLHIWYQDHKLVAQQTQSTFGYIRNTVVRPLTEGAPSWDGIVEEFFPIEALSDPKVWYAASSEEELQANLGKMIKSVQRFLDLSPLESHPMSRYECA